jgi:glyoxylase-like metal-dependent hydrolase (beta-lactamase superfamily II)
MIVESIRKLGFDPRDIKILINGHGHSDHAGALAFFKKLTGAQVAIETSSGRIESDFTMKVTRTGSDELRGTIGDGSGRISAETGSGSVRLQQR